MQGRIRELQPWPPAHRFLSSLYRLLLVISSSGLMSLLITNDINKDLFRMIQLKPQSLGAMY